MTEQYHKNLYNPSHLQTLLRDTDDKKYILVRELYEINNISYEKGSSDRDYAIRDMLQDTRRAIETYHDMVKYYDNAREGDSRVLEEIIIFFEKNYIDSSTLNDCIESLKIELNSQQNAPVDSNQLVQLKQRLNAIENRMDTRIDPMIRDFLQSVNLLLLFYRILHIVESTKKSTDQSGVATRTDTLKQYMTTFLWLYKKILPDSFVYIDQKSFILQTIRDMGFNESLVSRAIIGSNQLGAIAEEITGSIGSSTYVDDIPDNELQTHLSTESGKTHLDYINDLMELLYTVTYNKNDNTNPVLRFQGNIERNRDKRFLFHEPG